MDKLDLVGWDSTDQYHTSQQPANHSNLSIRPASHLTVMSPGSSPLPMIFADQKNQSTNHEVDTRIIIDTNQKEMQEEAFSLQRFHVCIALFKLLPKCMESSKYITALTNY